MRAAPTKISLCALFYLATAIVVGAEIYFEENFPSGMYNILIIIIIIIMVNVYFMSFTIPQIRLRPNGHIRNISARISESLFTARVLSTTILRPTREFRRRRMVDFMHCLGSSCRSVTKEKFWSSNTRSNTSRLLIVVVDTLSYLTVIWIQNRCTVKHHMKSCLVSIFR